MAIRSIRARVISLSVGIWRGLGRRIAGVLKNEDVDMEGEGDQDDMKTASK